MELTKEQLLVILNNQSRENVFNFLKDYCISKGKDVKLIDPFLQISEQLGMMPILFSYALRIVIEENNLDICEIKNLKNNQIIKFY